MMISVLESMWLLRSRVLIFDRVNRCVESIFHQMHTDGILSCSLPCEQFDGSETTREIENMLIENHGSQPQYSVPELTEKNFWRTFNHGLYEHCRWKYGALVNRSVCIMNQRMVEKLKTEVVHERELRILEMAKRISRGNALHGFC